MRIFSDEIDKNESIYSKDVKEIFLSISQSYFACRRQKKETRQSFNPSEQSPKWATPLYDSFNEGYKKQYLSCL